MMWQTRSISRLRKEEPAGYRSWWETAIENVQCGGFCVELAR